MDEFTKAAACLYDLARRDGSRDLIVDGIAAAIRSTYERGRSDERVELNTETAKQEDYTCQKCGDRLLVKTQPDGCCSYCHAKHINQESEPK